MIETFRIQDLNLVQDTDNPAVYFAIKPTPEEKQQLIAMGIDEHTYQSALDPEELARVELDDDYIAILCKTPKIHAADKPFQFEVTSLGVFLFKQKLVLICTEDLSEYKTIKVRSNIDVLLKIISRTIIHFREHLKAINTISDSLQGEINKAMSNQHLISLFSLQKSLVYYIDSITSNGMLLDRLKTQTVKLKLNEEQQELLDYNIIENAQCCKQAEIYSNILASLMDARASIISNNLNVLMKTLNVITISIMVPTFVVSAFSMNVVLPFAMSLNPFSFALILTLSLLSALGFMCWWKKKHP